MNTAILDRYVPAVLQKLLPNGVWSKADCDEHAVDVRIQDRQPSPSIRLDERRRFYEGFRGLLLAGVPYLGHCHSMLFYHLADGPRARSLRCTRRLRAVGEVVASTHLSD